VPDLHVSLNGTDLRTIVHVLSQLGASGSLKISADPWHGDIGLEHGHLVAASLGTQLGIGALGAILVALPRGQWSFVDQQPPTERNFDMPPDGLTSYLETIAAVSQALYGADTSMPGRSSEEGGATQLGTPAEIMLDHRVLQTLLATWDRRTPNEGADIRSLAYAM